MDDKVFQKRLLLWALKWKRCWKIKGEKKKCKANPVQA
jgi:hypothetical protein